MSEHCLKETRFSGMTHWCREYPGHVGPHADNLVEWEQDLTSAVNHPSHYTTHPSGVECITITEHMNFCVGNAMKYLWRAGLKGEEVEDLEKAAWYIAREIERRKK
jgi:hypothetical protein